MTRQDELGSDSEAEGILCQEKNTDANEFGFGGSGILATVSFKYLQ